MFVPRLGACLVCLVLLSAASATPVATVEAEPDKIAEVMYPELLMQLKSNAPSASLLERLKGLITSAKADLARERATCKEKETINSAKLAKISAELNSLKAKIQTAEKAVESQRDKMNADMGLIKSIRLMLKAHEVKPTRRLLTDENAADLNIKDTHDATQILTQLLQTPPTTSEDMKKAHNILDSLEKKLKGQLSNHAAKKSLDKLKAQEEKITIKKATFAQQASQYVLQCEHKVNAQNVFLGLAQELLKLKAAAPETKKCTPCKECHPCPVQNCSTAESQLTRCNMAASKCLAGFSTAKKQSNAALDKLAECQKKRKLVAHHEQFKAFKTFVYGKLEDVVKTSSLALERERNVTSTVRNENSNLRMRLEAAYESTKTGQALRKLESKNKWCETKLAAALSAK